MMNEMMMSSSERWVYAVSDVVTGLFYFLVPLPLIYFRVSFPHHVPQYYHLALLLFQASFFLCGTSHMWMTLLQTGISTHVFLLGVLKVITAIVSVCTLISLFRVVPVGLEFVRHSAGLDQQLKRKVHELEAALAEVRRTNMNKGLFISTISHELRNPLHAIMANTDFMLETPLLPDQRSLMGMIHGSVELMTHIVNDVLDLSRLEAGRMSFERIPVNVRERCRNVVYNLKTQSKPKQVRVSLLVDGSTPSFIISDPTRIDQLLINLTSNAIKFSGVGQQVTVSISRVDQIPTGPAPVTKRLDFKRGSDEDTSTDVTKLLSELYEPPITPPLSPRASAGAVHEVSEHVLLPCMSTSGGFNKSTARSICIDSFHRYHAAVDELDAEGMYPNEHKSIHVCDDGDESVKAASSLKTGETVFVRFTVRDSGIGISAQSLVQLFTAYTQAKLSTVREHGGSGLGLCICAEIVRSMRGCVVVTSELGNGSEFSFYLPVSVAQEQEWLALTRTTSPVPNQSKNSLFVSTLPEQMSKLVFVVDDNEVNRKILQRMLEKLGFMVQTASDGLKAVEAFKVVPSPSFFCVFMDISMPQLDGYEASRHIRLLGFKTPIVALTANVQNEDKIKSVAAGMNHFLTKPLKKPALEKVLQTILANSVQAEG